MTKQLLTALPEKTPQHVKSRKMHLISAPSLQGGLHPILHLQRTLGNRRVTQLMQAKRLTPDGKMRGVQRKLTVGAANDPYEQEADRVAHQVLNTPAMGAGNAMQRAMPPEEDKDQMLQTKPLAASITPFMQRQMGPTTVFKDQEQPVQAKLCAETSPAPVQRQPETEEEEPEPLQAKSAGSMSGSFDAGTDVETQISQSKGRGSPLPDAIRAYMEPRFGVDFSQVRAHTGSDALQMNQAVGAQAFTQGSDIYFGAGHSPNNLELTAHELTHVVQQTGSVQPQTEKQDEEVVPPGPEPPVQRLCTACAADDGEARGAELISRSGSNAATSTIDTKDGTKPGAQRQEDELTVLDQPATATQAEEPVSPAVTSADKQNGPVADAPSARYIVPFDRHPLAAPGERIIFRGDFTDPSPASYQLEYSTTGGHFTSATGPTTRTIAGLISGNVDFFVPTPWDGTSTVQVVLKVKKLSDNSVVRTETWDFGLKTRYPTTMTQREGTGEKNLPGVYTYDIGPAVVPYAPPFYQHQTILERFGNWSLANIVPADIAAAYRTTHSLNSVAAVSQHFLGNYAGNNGTFTVDGNDQIADQHGGHPDLSNLVSNLATPKDIEVALPQTYEARPGTALGNYTVTRVLKADGTTWKVKKG